jgi:hypothetical protein
MQRLAERRSLPVSTDSPVVRFSTPSAKIRIDAAVERLWAPGSRSSGKRSVRAIVVGLFRLIEHRVFVAEERRIRVVAE